MIAIDVDDVVTMGFAFFGSVGTAAIGAAHDVPYPLAVLPGLLIGAAIGTYLLGPLSTPREETG
ncbi:hypothetical protein ACFPYI_04405 [Halomarina salina]|uniref:Uncharacterized protein n=1 Tax=Halomarina salina TaxID=1872699 RepID=A0ABD5RJB5_9EURY|nr:hypothetical protein [Halomarina salina]